MRKVFEHIGSMAHCDRGGLDKIEATDGPKLISLYVFEILWLKKKKKKNPWLTLLFCPYRYSG